MKLKGVVCGVPEEVWEAFEPVLPPRIWFGIGRRPISNRVCVHALLDVHVSGIPRELMPRGFPSAKTIQRRSPGVDRLELAMSPPRR
jgi:transposase